MIYLSNDPYPQEISIPRSFGVIVPRRTEYLTRDDIATDLETDTDRKVLAASQGVRLKEMVDGKADASDVYTKTEVDDALADKADADAVYSKGQTDNLLDGKQDNLIPGENITIENNVISADVPVVDAYTRQQTDDLLALKADKADTYTKQQVDTALAGKQDTINDLQTIRDGAAAGETAYQKPQTGIPASDLADGVIPTIPVEDVKVGGTSVVNNKVAEIPAIPDAVEANPTIPAGVTPTDLQNLKVGDDFFSVPQGGGGEPEIFWATYGETTAQEVQNAIDAGKIVKAIYSNVVVEYNNENTTAIRFASLSSPTMKGLRVTLTRSNNRWSAETFGYELDSNKSQSVPTDRTSTTKYPSVKAVFDSLGKWGVISQTQTWTGSNATGWDYTMSNPVMGFIPLDFINMVGMFGAVFNESTGYFELNGLTDISYEEMRKIWFTARLGQEAKASGNFLQGTTARTNINTFTQMGTGTIGMGQLCGYSTLQVFNFQGVFAPITKLPNTIAWCFVSNYRLKKILPVGLDAINTTAGFANAFSGCASLEDVYIKNLKITTSFAPCPHLKLESVVYLVQNAANTSAITITLHATAYARCQADTTEYTYQGNTYTGILAFASARNITIASA